MAKLSRDEFLDQAVQIIRHRFPLVRVEVNAGDFAVRINDQWAHLENLYRAVTSQEEESGSEPDQLVRGVEQFVTEIIRASEQGSHEDASYVELRERILPVLLGKPPADSVAESIVSQQLLEGLYVAYVIDSDRSFTYVSKTMFESWKVEIDEVHEAALQNLVARSQALPAHAAQDEGGTINLILIQTMDGYDSSRLLLPGLHDRLKEHLGSPFLAGVPNRDILVCFRDEEDMIGRLKQQIAQDYRKMPHQISDRLYLVTADGIADFRP